MVKNYCASRGQSLIEILIAVAVVSIVSGGAIIIALGNQSLFLDKKLAARAAGITAEGIEAVQAIAEESWSNLTLGAHGLLTVNGEWEFSGTEDVSGIFTRTIQISSPETNTKDIVSTVRWQTDPARPLVVSLTERLTNWRGLFGDWANPRTLGSIDLGPGNSGTDLRVRNKIVYITAEASAAAKPDFYVVDAADGVNPSILSSIHTGPGLNAVDIAGNYAYVANDSSTNQLQVINISNPTSPTLISSFPLPGNSEEGLSVFVAGSYAYVGTDDGTGKEFYIVDVSNPASPAGVGSYEVGHEVSAIYVKDEKAYLATSDSAEVWVLDVSVPSNPTLISTYNAPGDSEDGKTVDAAGSRLYLGRTVGGNSDVNHELHILDITNPASLVNLGSRNFTSSILDLYARDYLIFLATDDSNNEFQIMNISDPANITPWSSFNFPQVATGIDYENNVVYVSVRSNDGLRIITSGP